MRAEKLGTKTIDLVWKNLLPEALNLLYSYHLKEDREKQVVQLNSRLADISRLDNMGVISPDFYIREKNKIRNSLLDLSYDIRSEGLKKNALFKY